MNHRATRPAQIAFAGGGSGGHINAAIALAEAVRRRSPRARLTFCISDRRIDSTVLATSPVTEHAEFIVQSLLHSGHARKRPMRFVQQLLRATRQCARAFRCQRPDAVVGVGGFASAPAVLAASRQKIPVFLVEQNCIPGRTTRWLARFSRCTFTGFPLDAKYLHRMGRCVRTGVPLRSDDRCEPSCDSAAGRESTVRSARPLLLILGGSQGAQHLNDLILQSFRANPGFLEDWDIWHQTGRADLDRVQAAWQRLHRSVTIRPFIEGIDQIMRQAELVVSRGGAMTIAELCRAGKASILVPLRSAADGHQSANAAYLSEMQAARVIHEPSSGDANSAAPLGDSVPGAAPASTAAREMAQALLELTTEPAKRAHMAGRALELAAPNAAAAILDIIEKEGLGISPEWQPSHDESCPTRGIA